MVLLSGLGPVLHAGELAYQLLGISLLAGHAVGYRLHRNLAAWLAPLCALTPALVIGLRNLAGVDSEVNPPMTLVCAFFLAVGACAPLAGLTLCLWQRLQGQREQLARLYACEMLGSALALALAILTGPLGLLRVFPMLAALAFLLYGRRVGLVSVLPALFQLVFLPGWLTYQAVCSHRALVQPRILELSLSAYQLVEVVESQGERYLFLNGLCHHDPRHLQALNYYLVSLPAQLLSTRLQTKRALVLGGGALLSAAELRRLGWQTTVVELDPEVLRLSAKHFAPSFGLNPDDPGLRLVCDDARSYTRADRHYDLIVFSLPYPYSLNVASLFTQEYFQSLRERLDPGGAVTVFLGTTAGRRRLEPVAAAILQSLRKVFPSILVISSQEMANTVVLCQTTDRWDRSALTRLALGDGYRRFHLISDASAQQLCQGARAASLWDLSMCLRLNFDLWRN
ncbi:MAG: fused MFS/spermidine synthase [Vulcanimicrobiota bacterium]